jgi:hypothetical protein
MATLVRVALEEAVANARPTARSLGIGASGSSDTARARRGAIVLN